MPEKLAANLVKIGLSEIEAKTYVALLDHYKLSAKELAQITGIFRTQIYDVLKTLIKKGYCTEILDSVKKYVAVDPELALQFVIVDLERRRRLAENLARQLHQLFISGHKDGSVQDKMIEVMHSPKAVQKRLRNYLAKTSTMILSFNKPPYQIRYNDNSQDMMLCSQAKVTHKAIFQIDNKEPQNSLMVARKFQEKGESVRLTEFLPMKMMVFDNARVFYQLSAEPESTNADTATFIQHPEITLTLINSFWVEWERAFTIEQFEQQLKNNKNPSSKQRVSL
jgi:sugar-specific transcriptional regulator TrmB